MPKTRRTSNIGRLMMMPSLVIATDVTLAINQAGFTDVRTAHGNVLSFIGHGPKRLTDLAQLANLTKATMNYLVDDLERLGYVQRQEDPTDRRAKLVGLTPKGHEVGKVTVEALRQLEERWRALVGAERYELFRAVLLDINESAWSLLDDSEVTPTPDQGSQR